MRANTAGQGHALTDCYGQHRRTVARTNLILWPTPNTARQWDVLIACLWPTSQAGGTLWFIVMADTADQRHASINCYHTNTHPRSWGVFVDRALGILQQSHELLQAHGNRGQWPTLIDWHDKHRTPFARFFFVLANTEDQWSRSNFPLTTIVTDQWYALI